MVIHLELRKEILLLNYNLLHLAAKRPPFGNLGASQHFLHRESFLDWLVRHSLSSSTFSGSQRFTASCCRTSPRDVALKSAYFQIQTSGTTLALLSSSKLLGQPSHYFQLQNFWDNPHIIFSCVWTDPLEVAVSSSTVFVCLC